MRCCDKCNKTESVIVPLGRTRLSMIDGGIVEILLFTCTVCRAILIEHAAVYTTQIPDYKGNQ